MMDHALRKVKDDLFLPVAREVGKSLSPLTITLAAGVVGIGAAVAAWQGAYGLGLALWLFNRVLDGLDGAVARVTGQQSDFGGLLDTLVDFTLYAIIPLGLVLHAPTLEKLLALGVMLTTFYINAGAFLYLSAILERRNQGAKATGELTTIHMPRGIIEGAEAILFYCAFFLFPDALVLLFTLLAALVMATAMRHLVWAALRLR
jgi:phosphatidylglycerophosphate synthase